MHTKMPVARPGVTKAGRKRGFEVAPTVAVNSGRPLAVVIVVLALAVISAILLWHSVSLDDGHFVFSLDDPYIHLAMARTLAFDGVWGVQPQAFSATSSAPLYTLLLAAAFLIGGASVAWAWLFAMVGGLAVAGVLTYEISRHFDRTGTAVILGVFAVTIAGVPEMMFSGMEHTLHMTAVALIALVAASQVEKSDVRLRSGILLAVLVLIACGLRYESLFIVPALVGFLWWIGRRRDALIVGVASVLPAIILGVVQLANGQMFLPNTLMLKAVVGYGSQYGYIPRLILQIGSHYVIALMVLVGLGVFIDVFHESEKRANPRLLLGAMFLSTCVFQATFAKMDRRYVGYLLVLGIIAAVPYAAAWLEQALAMIRTHGTSRIRPILGGALLVCIGVAPFSNRIIDLERLPRLTHDIYAQQYQLARFLSEEYPGTRVALNDIGTTCWFGKNWVLDLWGLADGGVAKARARGQWKRDKMRDYAAAVGVEVVAIYPNWFSSSGGVPREWIPVGSWALAGIPQVNVAQQQVVFFATSQSSAQTLKMLLEDFAAKLPPGVIQTSFI